MSKPTIVYRITTEPEFAVLQQTGHLPFAAIDAKDGYVHMSTAAQSWETFQIYFATVQDVVLLEVDVSTLDNVKWEPVASRGGEEFPHYYNLSGLPKSSIVKSHHGVDSVKQALQTLSSA